MSATDPRTSAEAGRSPLDSIVATARHIAQTCLRPTVGYHPSIGGRAWELPSDFGSIFIDDTPNGLGGQRPTRTIRIQGADASNYDGTAVKVSMTDDNHRNYWLLADGSAETNQAAFLIERDADDFVLSRIALDGKPATVKEISHFANFVQVARVAYDAVLGPE